MTIFLWFFTVIVLLFWICIFFAWVYSIFFPTIEVVGDSMFPTYKDGEIVRAKRFFPKDELKIGDVIIFKAKKVTGDSRYVIKRIADMKKIDGKLYLYVLGDNSDVSYDSRYYGFFSAKYFKGRLLEQYQKTNGGR